MDKKYFGAMLDMSRGAVMKVEKVKEYAKTLASFGYNMLQLYTEDTYEVNDEQYFGYMRGGYTQEELKEIDAYCNSIGIELVPCIQTLAHLLTIFRWEDYKNINDTEDILLIGEDRTYKLIENIFSTLENCFTSRKVHIGMDEAYLVGRGKYFLKHGYEFKFDILQKHLTKVKEIAEKHGFSPMIWSDMYFRLDNKGVYCSENPMLSDEAKNAIPKDIGLVYWDYYHESEEFYSNMIKAHQEVKNDLWFAGGAWTWTGFTPANDHTFKTMKPAMDACKKQGVENIFITVWGDDGSECSYFGVLPSLFFIKKYYDGETDLEKIKKEFNDLTGEDFNALLEFDKVNLVGKNTDAFNNVSKYMLYNDPFFGVFDTTASEGVSAQYKKLTEEIASYKKTSKKFGYLFDYYSALANALSYKYDLGIIARKAYKSGDKKELKKLINRFSLCEKAVSEFHAKFKTVWTTENRPNGFEIHDIRLGGLIQRLKTCKEKIVDYVKGKTASIPELETELLDFCGKGKDYTETALRYNFYTLIASVNPFYNY